MSDSNSTATGGGNTSTTTSIGGNSPGFVPAGGGGSNANPGTGGTYSGNVNAPQVIELNDDSMVRLPGAKEPVKYGDHSRGFQSEFTKRSQEVARYKAEVQKYQQQLQQLQRQQAASTANQPGQNKPPNLAEQIKSLPYLSGEDASRVVGELTNRFGQYDQELQRRDMALGLIYKQLQEQQAIVKQLHGRTSSSDFNSKISNWVRSAGIPEGAAQWAKELYLAYEGDDLDQEFPRILSERWGQVQNAIKSQRQQEVQAARNRPFLPGKGGQATPGAPLNNFKNKSAREIADSLWPGMVDGEVDS